MVRNDLFALGYKLTEYPRPPRDADELVLCRRAVAFIDRIVDATALRALNLPIASTPRGFSGVSPDGWRHGRVVGRGDTRVAAVRGQPYLELALLIRSISLPGGVRGFRDPRAARRAAAVGAQLPAG